MAQLGLSRNGASLVRPLIMDADKIFQFDTQATQAARASVTKPLQLPFTVRDTGFNNDHGNPEAAGTFGISTTVLAADRPPIGEADFHAAHLEALEKLNPLNVVVGAGDLIGVTPLVWSLLADEPPAEALSRIGLEFSSVGHHNLTKVPLNCRAFKMVVLSFWRALAVGTAGQRWWFCQQVKGKKKENKTDQPDVCVGLFEPITQSNITHVLRLTPNQRAVGHI